ncbi:hypothetical protein [Peribacillus frigoritolerans]|uniref:hypothetical protein n=1 Tax=Peribacillus frigoritolerans TaxID=450367 RepID=UPI00203D0258|nr:hypothetical protein [Peribacillus frigoritolerans]MCM3166988.1 hypothetical protein [Peribacillus frigoritolerans]
MLTFLALLMIIVFIVLLSKNKLSVFGALTIIPFVFGAIATFVTGASFLDLLNGLKKVFFLV